MGKLTEDNSFKKVQEKIEKLDAWNYKDRKLKKEIIFNSYPEAVLFVNMLACIAQSLNHHPDIILKYNFVSVHLSTHDIDDVSLKDIEFAEKMDRFTQG